MKCFVRLREPWKGILIGLGSLLLVGVVQQETVVSYVIVASLAVLLARGEWLRHRREKNQTSGRA
jgi:hypothetical protein